jgi:flagella basal body P-ring formation protein FlgA
VTKYLLLILISLQLQAVMVLKKTYYVDSKSIKLNNIFNNAPKDTEILKIPQNKHRKKIKTTKLIKILNDFDYNDIKPKHAYVVFIQKSPIDTSKIKSELTNYYKEHYSSIEINNIIVEPRSYMESLPQEYIVEIKSKYFLSRDGILAIKTPSRKKIFLNYFIDARVNIYLSKEKIKKKTTISAVNTIKKSIILDKFKAQPIEDLKINTIQAKQNISKNKILTIRNVETLSIIKKNSYINIEINDRNMNIIFIAKAMQDGRYGETIKVKRIDGKTLRVKVIGKNKAELR